MGEGQAAATAGCTPDSTLRHSAGM